MSTSWKDTDAPSKDEVKHPAPPVTVALVEDSEKGGEGLQEPGHDGYAHDIHGPTPSSDSADPLNWPTWRKFALLLTSALYAFTANFQAASIAPALTAWPLFFPQDAARPFSQLTNLFAVSVLALGAANIWWVPMSNGIGRRPTLILATLVVVLATIWCALATSYESLLAARTFQGIGGAAADTVSPAIIGDVFVMDQRGRAMAVYTVFLAAGPIIGGIVGGYIAFSKGFSFIFWVGLVPAAVVFLGHVFLVPETLFNREAVSVDPVIENKKPLSFARSLGLGNSTFRRRLTIAHFVQPWKTLVLPGTWVVMLHYGGLVGGIVAVSAIGPQLVAMPPYLWGSNAGLINIGALIGTLLGAIYTYFLADWQLKRQARKRTSGQAEPEDRLPSMFPALAIATAGFLVFGFSAQYPGGNRWVGLQFGYGMIAFGLVQAPSIGFNYLIDAYKRLAADCFVVVTILRAVIAFAWTFFVASWAQARGPAEPFGIFGLLMGIFSLLTVPLWLYGKRLRMRSARHLDK